MGPTRRDWSGSKRVVGGRTGSLDQNPSQCSILMSRTLVDGMPKMSPKSRPNSKDPSFTNDP